MKTYPCYEPSYDQPRKNGHLLYYSIKHRVQNFRRVPKPKPIASTHAQMFSRIAHLIVGVSIDTTSMHGISD